MSTAFITGAKLEELTGFEPAIMVLQTTSLTCLDTTPPEKMARMSGVEPKIKESKSFALPLGYILVYGGLSWN